MKHFEGLENEKTNLTELQMQYLINRGLAHKTQTPYMKNVRKPLPLGRG